MTTITLTAEDFQFLTAFVSSMFAAVVIFLALPRTEGAKDTTFARLQEALGAKRWPAKWFLAVAVFWAILALCLFGGLIATIGMIVHQLFFAEDFTANRFPLIQLAALTATLGAVVALPFTVLRLKLTQEQTETAKAALFNDKITEAAADLYAQRQVSKETDSGWETVWEDDVVRRNAAIDRLEGLVREQPEEAARVSRLLSVYVRELSKEFPAKKPPTNEDIRTLRGWARALEVPRSDMQNAVQVLGRLATIEDIQIESLEIDLSETNLQAMRLENLHFTKADFRKASLQGAGLQNATMQEANLRHAKMQGTNFRNAKLRAANFDFSSMQGTDLRNAELQNAKLLGAKLQDADLRNADLSRAILGLANMQNANFTGAQLNETNLRRTRLNGANFTNAKMQKADLGRANLLGADLEDAKLDEKTNITKANLLAVSVHSVDFINVPQIEPHLPDLFGDVSTKLPPETPRPSHWPKENLDWDTFFDEWRDFAASKGVDISE